jgi:hypothetical protein
MLGMLFLLVVACGTPDQSPVTPDVVPPPPTELVLDTAVLDTGDPEVFEEPDPPGPPLCAEDGLEDNDDLDNAIPWTNEQVAVLGDDPDYWMFDLDPGETRRVELTFDHSEGNIDLTVYNELYLAVATSYSFSDDEAAEVTNTSSVPTTARIRVLLRDPGCNGYSVLVRPIGSGED